MKKWDTSSTMIAYYEKKMAPLVLVMVLHPIKQERLLHPAASGYGNRGRKKGTAGSKSRNSRRTRPVWKNNSGGRQRHDTGKYNQETAGLLLVGAVLRSLLLLVTGIKTCKHATNNYFSQPCNTYLAKVGEKRLSDNQLLM